MEKMKDLCSIKATLVDSVKEQLSHGIECVDAHEMGEVVDMIKDIYEAENYCMQSKYYKSIVEAMTDGSYGYNPNRYASSGRYASAGHGSRYGYMPYLEGEDYNMQQYLTGDPTEFADQMKLRFGYMDQNEPKMMNKPVSTYGAAYDSWSDARKHYTKTGSSEDKERMERHDYLKRTAIMDRFSMNGYLWRIKFVNPNDKMLMDRTGKMTLATTDPNLATIFMSRSLSGALLIKVLIHELGHCALVSYGLLDDIHKVVKPEYWILAEEWVCNFIADYGAKIFSIAYSILGNDAWMFIPYELDKVIA